LDDTSKSKNEETPKPPVEDVKEETAEEPQPEETSEKQTEGKSDNEEEKPSEQVEKTDKKEKPTEEPSKVEEQPTEEAPKTKEEKPAEEEKTEEPPKEEAGEPEKAEEKPEQPTESHKDEGAKETKGEEKPEQPVESKAKKDAGKAETETKKKHEKDDFKYIVRLANTDIAGEKAVAQGLTSIKGVGAHMSVLIIDETGIDRSTKMGNLTDAQIEKIRIALGNITKNAPVWMFNRRKDYDTGKDIHLIGPEIDMRLRDEINIMKKIRSYRGIRHERGLSVRGQRTRANGCIEKERTG